eukprot:snap_masked-scaffold_37-processed-gene-0.25-mRNA-1 protein AED:1.00 eAED:1.00 QI:0/0/0/0/1/1/3/0/79
MLLMLTDIPFSILLFCFTQSMHIVSKYYIIILISFKIKKWIIYFYQNRVPTLISGFELITTHTMYLASNSKPFTSRAFG